MKLLCSWIFYVFLPNFFRVAATASSSSSMTTFVRGPEVLSAEVYWVLDVMEKHGSFNSCTGKGDAFSISCFQIPTQIPHCLQIHLWRWQSSLPDNLWYCTTCMCWWPPQTTTHQLQHCWDSWHIATVNGWTWCKLEAVWHIVQGLGRGNWLQTPQLGSCGLHIMHNAFKAGSSATTWDTEHILNSLFWLFMDSPARRDDYTKVTGSTVFPLRYCQHRWLVNVTVLERAITIWPQIQTYYM